MTKPLCWFITAALLGALSGCHRGGASGSDLVIRDLRLQEDRIFELESYIHKYQAMLESCHRENESLKKALADRSGQDELPRTGGPATDGALTPPTTDIPGLTPPGVDPGIGPGGLVPPSVDPGIPLEPNGPMQPGQDEPLVPPGLVPPEVDSADAGRQVRLVLNKRLTGGLNSDGHPGDDGVMVVIEPRDADGAVVHVPGEVSLMIVDANRTGVDSHIARWDFTNEEATAAWRRTLLGHGMHFSLLWPNKPPETSRLKLYARVKQADGRKLLAEMDFDIDVPGQTQNQAPDGFAPRASNEWVRSEVRIPSDPQPIEPSRDSREVPEIATRPRERRAPARESGAVRGESQPQRPTWQPFR
jgi:hypothetical protein